MYELVILAQLMRYPAHGYLIAKIINDMIGPFARISNGRLYPLLAKLEKAGLIATDTTHEQQGDRQLRSYKITEAGRRRFHELMMDTTSSPGEYQRLFSQKTAYFSFLKPIERLRLIDHYMNYCQTHVLHLTAEADDIVHQSEEWDAAWGDYPWSGSWVQDVLRVMQHSLDQWQLELNWAKSLREKELAQPQRDNSMIGGKK